MKSIKAFILLVSCLFSFSVVSAEEGGSFVLVKLPHFHAPQKLTGYFSVTEEPRFQPVSGVFLEQAVGDEEAQIVWGAFLPADVAAVNAVVVLVEDPEGDKHFFEFREGEFEFYPPQTPDEIRERIAVLREQIDQSTEEKKKLEQGLLRLERDARLIGGFEALEEIERERDIEAQELKRIRLQIAQLKRSIGALKQWKNPTNLLERKQVLIKDIRELQEKVGG